jgi:nucleoside-diphosphate-sugar epimerase
MTGIPQTEFIARQDDLILVTGATGFIGSRVVKRLLERGFRNVRCFTRASSNLREIEALQKAAGADVKLEVIKGNLLSNEDCLTAASDVAVVLHLAAGTGEKSFPDAFMNSVVTTRNLLEACLRQQSLKRFLSISSFAVYSNRQKPHGRLLDESCQVEKHPEKRGDAYSFAKVKQDELIAEYGAKFGLPYVIVRPGYVYGPGKKAISGRVGIDTFGIFMHLGGSNQIPFTFVENCAEAIVLAGLKPGVEGEVFNVVDDSLPTSRKFLRQYKKQVRNFLSIYVPHFLSYALCYLWEKYSDWSEGQLPPAFNVMDWHVSWKRTRYSNEKLRTRLGWQPIVSTSDGLARFFEACRNGARNA